MTSEWSVLGQDPRHRHTDGRIRQAIDQQSGRAGEETDVGVENKQVRIRTDSSRCCVDGRGVTGVSAHPDDSRPDCVSECYIDAVVSRVVINHNRFESLDPLQAPGMESSNPGRTEALLYVTMTIDSFAIERVISQASS